MKSNYTPLSPEKKRQRKRKLIILFISGFLLYIFVYYNILASQNISSLYFSVVNEDRAAIVKMLKLTRLTPLYPEILPMQKAIYGNEIEQEVNKDFNQRSQMIRQLEDVLDKNPKATEVLKNIAILYTENGDKQKAESYLERAHEIDPMVQ